MKADIMAKRSEGTIDQLPSGKYRVRVRDGRKRPTIGTYATQKEANQALEAALTDIRRGDFFDESRGNITFLELSTRYMEVRRSDVELGTFDGWRSLLNTTLMPTFGDMRLRDIGVYEVEAWWATHTEKLVNRRNAYFLLRNMFNKAISWGYVRSNPCLIEKAGKDVSKPRPTFKKEHLLQMLKHIPEEDHVLFWVAYNGSLRLGELVGLNRGDFDASTGELTVERQVSDRGGAHTKKTKTGQVGTVPLYGEALDLLTEYVRNNPAMPNAPMFRSAKGKRISRAKVQRAWEKARDGSGLHNIHLQDLRHVSLTAWSRLPGVNLRDIQARGRHSTVQSALRYQHADNERATEFARQAEAMGL
jgi:integrase